MAAIHVKRMVLMPESSPASSRFSWATLQNLRSFLRGALQGDDVAIRFFQR
jgi:hypothetical protein